MSSRKHSRPSFSTEGSVVRITLRNFMTYKNETIYPGPSFNVTVGPNGSGKSSIVTALSICLGGDLKSLNRQLDMQSLINNDCGNQAAVIEIELYSKKSSNTVIKAVIKRGASEPSWQINDKSVTKEKLLSLTAKLQIQPNNLCQFLPQDVVREFPQMKPPEIFENTIKAVGDQEMLEKLYKGSQIQEMMESIESDLKTKMNTLSSLEQKERQNEEILTKIKKKEDLEEKKSVTEKGLAWEKFSTIRKMTKDTRDRKRKLEEKESALREELSSVKDFMDNYNMKTDAIKKNIESADQIVNKIRPEIEKFDIHNLEDQIEMLDTKEKDLDHDEKNRLDKKNQIENEIVQLKAFLEENPLNPADDLELGKLRDNWNQRSDQLRLMEEQLSDMEQAMKSTQTELTRLKKRERELISMKSRKLSVLEQENEDAYKAVLWLRNNKHRFKEGVYEPIMLCLDVKSPEYVKYVELHIGKADLEGFICEDTDDMNLLLKELRENLKLRRINVFQSKPIPLDKFTKPYTDNQLQKYGFTSYLNDMYDAPPAIEAYLCQQKSLHQVPVFEKEVDGVTDELKEKFRSYYIGNLKFNVKRSNYSGEISTGIEDISHRRPIRLADNIDTGLLQEVQNQIKEKENLNKGNETRKLHKENTKQKLLTAIQDLKNKMSAIEQRKRDYSSKEVAIKLKEEMLRNMKEPQVNIEAQRKEIKSQKIKHVKELWDQVSKNLSSIEQCGQWNLMRQAHQLQLRNVEGENQDSIFKYKELEKEHNTVCEQLNAVQEKFAEQTRDIKSIHTAATEATNGYQDANTKHRPPLEWQNKFKAANLSNDENILQAMIEDYASEIKRLNVKPDIMKKVSADREALKRVRKETQELEQKKEDKKQELNQLRKSWIIGIRKLVEEVNKEFMGMMDTLGYSGMVELQEGLNEDPLDIKNYGIKILVKFRSGEEFNELSRGTQSGGEKSVTTAVYMMALQGLTQVPFRCVDEINQGMDENNERLVWDMLLNVCKDHHAQYFYMAPKFPYNLPFDDQVTILICNSGSTKKKKDTDFSTKKFVQISRALKVK